MSTNGNGKQKMDYDEAVKEAEDTDEEMGDEYFFCIYK